VCIIFVRHEGVDAQQRGLQDHNGDYASHHPKECDAERAWNKQAEEVCRNLGTALSAALPFRKVSHPAPPLLQFDLANNIVKPGGAGDYFGGLGSPATSRD
jgi:hypothetical protein